VPISCGDSKQHDFTQAGTVAVFKLTVPSGGSTVTASTCADDMVGDTVVAMYSACPAPATIASLQPLASNDDDESCGSDETLSTTSAHLQGGQVVYITVENKSAYAAKSLLSITCNTYGA
jgi:hypothetical protein